jgi:hypothetical protein
LEFSLGSSQLVGILPEVVGFGSHFIASSISRVFLNGTPGVPFPHRHGLRLGDPHSALLFILLMEPRQRFLHLATANGVLSPLGEQAAPMCASFYANDADIFINPVKQV